MHSHELKCFRNSHKHSPMRVIFSCLFVISATLPLHAQGTDSTSQNIAAALRDSNGFVVHEVESKFQTGKTQIRVLLPDSLEEDRSYSVLYVLPVEAATESRYGDGLLEVKKLDLHNKYQIIFVAPTFAGLPWYADHPTNKSMRQESHLLKVVLPLVEKDYPVKAEAEGRLLLGFSKSGWGAWSLLLRHPQVFGRAAAWDAPLMMERIGKYGNTPIFGTQENFELYRITSLLPKQAKNLGKDTRLILTGFGNFRTDLINTHNLLQQLKIPHEFRDGPQRKHHWSGGWLEETVKLLINK